MARPKTKPAITGREKKAVMNPNLSSPAATKMNPVTTMKPDASTA